MKRCCSVEKKSIGLLLSSERLKMMRVQYFNCDEKESTLNLAKLFVFFF